MMRGKMVGGWSGPPLALQILALLTGTLIIAQAVTLLLTLILPPAPPNRYELTDIAARLAGGDGGARPLERRVVAAAPDLSGRGWLTSPASRTALAQLLHVPENQVVLGFYTTLPVGGLTNEPAPVSRTSTAARDTSAAARLAMLADRMSWQDGAHGLLPALPIGWAEPAVLLQSMPGGPPGGAPGGFPGGFPGGQTMPRDMPRSEPRDTPRDQPRDDRRRDEPARRTDDRQPGRSEDRARQPAPDRAPAPPTPSGPPVTAPIPLPPLAPIDLIPIQPVEIPPRRIATPAPPPPAADTHITVAPSTPTASPSAASEASAMPITSPTAGTVATTLPPARPAARVAAPQPLTKSGTGLFGFAPDPFVEGDFVAAVQQADGRWAMVLPRAEGFPNAWQRRVLLWFLLSLLVVAPFAWLFARRIVLPLRGFAHAAEALGRDPAAAIVPLDGPAEVGRAAHAFNLMRNRLRTFVDDRTAMIGAISHDLRTPLTRLRFRIEDVPDDQYPALLAEIDDMEAMIASVIEYLRDATTANARERIDLADLIGDVVRNAVMVGGDAAAVASESAPVEVDALSMRRVLDNLIANALKYGHRARVALHVENACAIADVVDDGPGIPEQEIERVFEPFYRSEAARASTRGGNGLGLAICRSIARAHGGDVVLFHSDQGFVARVSMPLAFAAAA